MKKLERNALACCTSQKTKEEEQQDNEIEYVIGAPIMGDYHNGNEEEEEEEEVVEFRKKMFGYLTRFMCSDEFEVCKSYTSYHVIGEPLKNEWPISVIDPHRSLTAKPLDLSSEQPCPYFLMRIRCPELNTVKTVRPSYNETADCFLEKVVQKFFRCAQGSSPQDVDLSQSSEWILQIPGRTQFLVGDILLSNFTIIQDYKNLDERVELLLVRRVFDDRFTHFKDPSTYEDLRRKYAMRHNLYKKEEKTQISKEKMKSLNKANNREVNIFNQDSTEWIPIRQLVGNDYSFFSVTILGCSNINLSCDVYQHSINKASSHSAVKTQIFASVGVYNGEIPLKRVEKDNTESNLLVPEEFTNLVDAHTNINWDTWIEFFMLPHSSLPRYANLVIALYARHTNYTKRIDNPDKLQDLEKEEEESGHNTVTSVTKTDFMIGAANVYIFNHKDELRMGRYDLKLHSYNPAPQDTIPTVLSVQFQFYLPIKSALNEFCEEEKEEEEEEEEEDDDLEDKESILLDHSLKKDKENEEEQDEERRKERSTKKWEDKEKILQILQKPHYETLTGFEKKLLQKNLSGAKKPSSLLLSKFEYLPKLIVAARSSNYYVEQLRSLLPLWSSPQDTLSYVQLLHPELSDPFIQSWALSKLEKHFDQNYQDLHLNLWGLIQLLKYEPYYNSALLKFILKRAIADHTIGIKFFWMLKSELFRNDFGHNGRLEERFSKRIPTFLEMYLRFCGNQICEIHKQNTLISSLEGLVAVTRRSRGRATDSFKDASLKLKGLLQTKTLVSLSEPTLLPFSADTSIEVDGVVAEKSQLKDTKRMPLWLTFWNSISTEPIGVIYKHGENDAIKREIFSSLVIQFIDKIWRESFGLNLGLFIATHYYQIAETGHHSAMIQIIPRSASLSQIREKELGSSAVHSSISSQSHYLKDWLSKSNAPHKESKILNKFTRSCAAYIVLAFIVKWQSFYPSNILITKDGTLCLSGLENPCGRSEFKFGIRREKPPFLILPEFVVCLMGSEQEEVFKQFLNLCKEAFIAVRKKAEVITSMLKILSVGIMDSSSSQTMHEEYWKHLSEIVFKLDRTEDEAAEQFEKLILDTITRARKSYFA